MTDGPVLYWDTETFSETPIAAGTHRYASDPSAEIMIHTWALDDPLYGEGVIGCWDVTAGSDMPDELARAIANRSIPIVGQNFGNFDRNLLHYTTGIEIEPERIEDTMVQAMSHGLPGSLDKLCEIFKVPMDLAKAKSGKALIQLFCKPRPKNNKLRRATRHTHPEEWQQFLDYAKSDISSMRYLRRVMPSWNYPGKPTGNALAPERALWCLDQRINDRGFRVDVELAERAIEAVGDAQAGFKAETIRLTDGEVISPMQRDALLKHLLEAFGVSLPDMTSSTLERRINDPDLPEPVRELLAIRQAASTTSTTKFKALLKSVSPDDRLRGTMQFAGASRTGRWSGRLFQPQNLMRPTMKPEQIADAIAWIKNGTLDLMTDDPMLALSNVMRGAIVAAPGRKLVQADLAQIEARVLPWLAGERWKLEAFKAFDKGEGPDLYTVGAGIILGKPADAVTKDERQAQGKVPELACGYGGAVGAFHSMAKIYGLTLPDVEAKRIVDLWRKKNPAIADWNDGFWSQLDRAARQAIENPGTTTKAGEHIRFHRQGEWLRMRLPSGRLLVYARPKIVEDPRWENKTAISYFGMNNYTRKWERLYTYGGKLSADATQATARDIMASNLPAIEEAGFPVVLLCHDEVVTEPLDDPQFSKERLVELLTRRPEWIDESMSLAADGYEAMRYRK